LFYLNLVYVTYTRDFALFKKDKRYRSFREEKQDFHGEIRSLQKIIRELKKEVSRLRKYEEYCLQNEHFVKKRTEKKQVRKNRRILEEELLNEKPKSDELQCDKCKTFNVQMVTLLNKTYAFCNECDYRKRISKDEK